MTIRKTYLLLLHRVRYAYNRLYIHFNRLLSIFNLSKYLNTICWSWDIEWIWNENSSKIGIIRLSIKPSETASISPSFEEFPGSRKMKEAWKRERNQKEKEREKERETNILSPTDIELAEEIGFIFDEKGLFSLLRVASPYYKITLYVNGVFDRWGTRHNCV